MKWTYSMQNILTAAGVLFALGLVFWGANIMKEFITLCRVLNNKSVQIAKFFLG